MSEEGILGLDEGSRVGASDYLASRRGINGSTRYAAFTDIQFMNYLRRPARVWLYRYRR
jgi:hypothetical protein